MRTLGRKAEARPRRRVHVPVPAAARAERPGWRDPRILLGLLLVCGCVLLGAKVLASADDTVTVWSARQDLAAGTILDRDDLRLSRVHFAEAARLARYVGEADLPSDGAALTRDVAAGELLPHGALGDGGDPLVEVPLEVARGDLPATVRAGAVVDVWVTPGRDAAKQAPARLLLDDVRVVALPASGDRLAPETSRQVIVGVPEDAERLGAVIGSLGDGRLVVTQRSAVVVQP